MNVKQRWTKNTVHMKNMSISRQSNKSRGRASAHLDENSKAVIGVSRGIQVVFVFLSDVRNEHGH